MALTLCGSVLHSSFQRGTICTKEAKLNQRAYPKFGSFLFIVDHINFEGYRIAIDRKRDIDRLSSLSNNTLEEARLIVEVSVLYDVQLGTILPTPTLWDDMIPYLAGNQDHIGSLEINKLTSIEFHIPPSLPSKMLSTSEGKRMESLEETRARFTRINRDRRNVSFIVKSRATEMKQVSILGDYTPSSIAQLNLGVLCMSAAQGRELLLKSMEAECAKRTLAMSM
jgi:hypothetical protein